jgi:hypothetical protein
MAVADGRWQWLSVRQEKVRHRFRFIYRLTLATAKSIAGLLPCLFEALVLLKY